MRRNFLAVVLAGIVGLIPVAVAVVTIDPTLFREQRMQVIDQAKQGYRDLSRWIKPR